MKNPLPPVNLHGRKDFAKALQRMRKRCVEHAETRSKKNEAGNAPKSGWDSRRMPLRSAEQRPRASSKIGEMRTATTCRCTHTFGSHTDRHFHEIRTPTTTEYLSHLHPPASALLQQFRVSGVVGSRQYEQRRLRCGPHSAFFFVTFQFKVRNQSYIASRTVFSSKFNLGKGWKRYVQLKV